MNIVDCCKLITHILIRNSSYKYVIPKKFSLEMMLSVYCCVYF
jgi:hypothetical protein